MSRIKEMPSGGKRKKRKIRESSLSLMDKKRKKKERGKKEREPGPSCPTRCPFWDLELGTITRKFISSATDERRRRRGRGRWGRRKGGRMKRVHSRLSQLPTRLQRPQINYSERLIQIDSSTRNNNEPGRPAVCVCVCARARACVC